jgi:hypothetical protein
MNPSLAGKLRRWSSLPGMQPVCRELPRGSLT